MHSLDFFSEAPVNYIFQKDSNKTNLGGVFFLIYIIIMFFISLYYILDYVMNNKYEIECTTYYNGKLNSSLEDELNNNTELNPILDFYLEFYKGGHHSYHDRIVLYDHFSGEYLNRTYDYNGIDYFHIKRRVSDFSLIIEYICDDLNCTYEDEDDEEELFRNRYSLMINYKGFTLTHQNSSSPLQLQENFIDFFYEIIPFYFDYSFEYTLNWQILKYKEQKGLSNVFSKQKDEYIYGFIKDYKSECFFLSLLKT